MDQWAKLTTVMGEVQANLLAGFLAGEGIRVKFRTHVPHSVYPIMADGLAEVQVMVPTEDLPRAVEALTAYHSHDSSETEEA